MSGSGSNTKHLHTLAATSKYNKFPFLSYQFVATKPSAEGAIVVVRCVDVLLAQDLHHHLYDKTLVLLPNYIIILSLR